MDNKSSSIEGFSDEAVLVAMSQPRYWGKSSVVRSVKLLHFRGAFATFAALGIRKEQQARSTAADRPILVDQALSSPLLSGPTGAAPGKTAKSQRDGVV